MTEPVIRSIPLHRLERSPANVRRTEAGKTAFAELKASIAAHGLLENLVARSIRTRREPRNGSGGRLPASASPSSPAPAGSPR